MTGPDHHAEMEAHYATGRDLSEALMRVRELEAENAQLRVDASNHAYKAEVARRERDKAEDESAHMRKVLKDYRDQSRKMAQRMETRELKPRVE